MIIGTGDHASVSRVTARWPSEKSFTCENISEGTLLTAFENRTDEPFAQRPYRSSRAPAESLARPRYQLPFAKRNAGKIQVFTTTATWCAACIGHLPSLTYLQTDDIALFGVPTDPNDTPAMLRKYLAEKILLTKCSRGLAPQKKNASPASLPKICTSGAPFCPQPSSRMKRATFSKS